MKILTLNLWNINEPLIKRMRILKKFLIDVEPDCICFQEISKVNNTIQIDQILRELNYKYTYCLSGLWKNREEGLVIATKLPHKLILSKKLTLIKNDMERSVMGVEILHSKIGKVYIFNTHLAYHISNNSGRLEQIKEVLEYIQGYANKGVIIFCGDLNEAPDQGKLYHFIESYEKIKLKDTCDSNLITFSSKNKYVSNELWPNRKIDYIFYYGNINLKSKLVMVEDDEFGCCSDHYGLLAQDY